MVYVIIGIAFIVSGIITCLISQILLRRWYRNINK